MTNITQRVSFQEYTRLPAVKTVKKPVVISFRTKNGEVVSFQAVKTVKKPASQNQGKH